METEIIPIPGFHEPVSSMTHLFGTAPFAMLAVLLVMRAMSRPRWGQRVFWISVLIFSTLFLLSMSGVYHLLERGSDARYVLQHLDHAAIFVLIAGTFTTAHGIVFTGGWKWGMLALIWGLVAVAIPLIMVFFAHVPEILSLILYLSMGWLGLVSGIKLWSRFGYKFIRYLLWGGIAYSVGAIAEFMRGPVLIEGIFGPHEFFHVAVLIGLACHWAFTWQFANGQLPMSDEEKMRQKTAEGIQEIIHRAVPLAEDYSLSIEAVETGYACVRLPAATRLQRVGGSLSGPATMLLVDTAMYALMLHDYDAEEMALTSDVQLRFLKRTPSKDAIAHARSLRHGSRMVVIEVEVRADGSDETLVHATGTYMLPHKQADS